MRSAGDSAGDGQQSDSGGETTCLHCTDCNEDELVNIRVDYLLIFVNILLTLQFSFSSFVAVANCIHSLPTDGRFQF